MLTKASPSKKHFFQEKPTNPNWFRCSPPPQWQWRDIKKSPDGSSQEIGVESSKNVRYPRRILHPQLDSLHHHWNLVRHSSMYEVRKESLILTPGTPLTAYLDTVTPKRYINTKIIINHCQIAYSRLHTLTLTFAQIPVIVKDILYLTAVLNSCINPIIYGVYYFSERRLTRYPSTNTTRAMIHFSSRQYLTSYKCYVRIFINQAEPANVRERQ